MIVVKDITLNAVLIRPSPNDFTQPDIHVATHLCQVTPQM